MNQKNVNLSSNTIWTDTFSNKVQQDILSSIWEGISSLTVNKTFGLKFKIYLRQQ